jgi:hypothetical protein
MSNFRDKMPRLAACGGSSISSDEMLSLSRIVDVSASPVDRSEYDVRRCDVDKKDGQNMRDIFE